MEIIIKPLIIKLAEKVKTCKTKTEYKNCLNEIKSEKEKYSKYSTEYIHLTHLNCIIHQEISLIEPCSIDEIKNHLKKALECAKEIEILSPYLDVDYPINDLVAMQEKACILSELGRFENYNENLYKSINIYRHVRKNTNDIQLINLTRMNEAKIRFELANKDVNPHTNCLKSLKLSEKAKKYFKSTDHRYNLILRNMTYAFTKLSKLESYGFEMETINIVKKLNNKISREVNLSQLKNDLNLIDLGIKSPNQLNTLQNNLIKIKQNLNPKEYNYQEAVVFEGEILLKKAEFSTETMDKIKFLNDSINHFNNLTFEDNYYNAQILFKIAYAKLQLANIKIQSEKNLKHSIDLFINSLIYYNNVPFQNNEYFIAVIGLNLIKAKKQLSLIEDNLEEHAELIEDTLFESLDYYEKNNNKEEIIECYLELGDLFFKIKNYNKSYYYLSKGINLVELIRSSILDFNIKKKFFEKIKKLFELMIETCIKLNKKEEALKFVELSKHRIFLDKIIENQKNRFTKHVNEPLIYELNNINIKIKDRLNKIKNFDKYDFEISSNYEKFRKLKEQQEYYLYKIKTEYLEYYDYYYNQVFDYKKLNLKNKTFLEYYYTDEFLLIFLIENEKFIVERVDFKEYNLKTLINDFEKQLINYDNLEKTENILNKLFNILIESIHEDISNDNLIIIPYKGLHNIPFNCLKDNDENYLIDKYTITIAQSGLSLKYIENNYVKPSEEEYLVIGNPTDDLEYAEKEAVEISKLFKTKPLLKEEATKENILKNIEGKSIIHFTGHGRFDAQNPLNSSLKLYNGELLYINDLNNLDLNSELIVLSACETGIVSVDDNDETEGFVKYLQIDGTKYIIASLWKGYDNASYELFKIFYSITGDYSKRLQLAQLELKKNYDLFYWGNFQIYGI